VYETTNGCSEDWTISDCTGDQQTFTATNSGQDCDLNMQFLSKGTITIEYYENDSMLLMKTRQIIVE